MLLNCPQPHQHIFLPDVLFPFIISSLEQSWQVYCFIIFYGLGSPFPLQLAERRIHKPVSSISLLPKNIDQQNCKSGVRRRNKHPQTGAPVTNITLHVACCVWILVAFIVIFLSFWAMEMNKDNKLSPLCLSLHSKLWCLSTQEITITPLKSE